MSYPRRCNFKCGEEHVRLASHGGNFKEICATPRSLHRRAAVYLRSAHLSYQGWGCPLIRQCETRRRSIMPGSAFARVRKHDEKGG